MTTSVKVEARCGNDTEVEVTVTDPNTDTERFVLQDGESAECYVYDDRVITVKEVKK